MDEDVLLTVPGVVIFGLLLAVTLNAITNVTVRGFFTSLYFVPYIVPLVAVALVWRYMYLPGPQGLFNVLLGYVGIAPVRWLSSSDWALPSLALLRIWKISGYAMVLFLAGLAYSEAGSLQSLSAQLASSGLDAGQVAQMQGMIAAVPEPGTLSVLGVGALGLLARRRRHAFTQALTHERRPRGHDRGLDARRRIPGVRQVRGHERRPLIRRAVQRRGEAPMTGKAIGGEQTDRGFRVADVEGQKH